MSRAPSIRRAYPEPGGVAAIARTAATGVSAVLALSSLLPVPAASLQEDSPPPADALARYDLDGLARNWRLPPRLAEISGLATTADGRLFAHDDERAVIYELDYRAGELVKAWAMGESPVRGDFEGIAVVGDRVWLVNSDGWLFEAEEGEDDDRLLYNAYGTGVGRDCEVEGLAYEPADDTLLLLCKTPRVNELEGIVAIYRWSPDERRLVSPPIRLRLAAAGPGFDREAEFRPSGIERDPVTGHYVLIAARDQYIAEVEPDGTWIGIRPLDPDAHEQPEGIAFGPDGTLFLADEARRGRARLTLYEPRPEEPPR